MSDENALADESAIETPVTEDAAPEAEIQADSDVEQEKETEPKRPSRAKDRIQELVAEKRAAIEYADFHRKRAEELESQLKARSTPAENKSRPVLADFQTPEEWADAVTDWASDAAASAAQKHAEKVLSERDTRNSDSQKHQALMDQMDDASKNHDDYWDVVLDPNAPLPTDLVNTVQEFDKAGELLYFLASHPQDARKIAAMTPTKRAAEIARLEGKVMSEKPKPTPKPKVTEAPDPPTPLGGGPAQDVDLAKLAKNSDATAYIKARRAQLRAS